MKITAGEKQGGGTKGGVIVGMNGMIMTQGMVEIGVNRLEVGRIEAMPFTDGDGLANIGGEARGGEILRIEGWISNRAPPCVGP